MVKKDKDPDLKSLEDRLKTARGRSMPEDEKDEVVSPVGIAWRLGIELVVGVAIGLFIGTFIDDWLGTKPVAMIIMVFLGFGAGVLNVVREAGKMQVSDDDPTGPEQ